MVIEQEPSFDPKSFLANVGEGRSIGKYRKNQVVFSQGDAADSVFYIQKGKVKLTVVSEQGKEAVVAIQGPDEFCGEGCLTGQSRRMATASAMTECEIMRLEKGHYPHPPRRASVFRDVRRAPAIPDHPRRRGLGRSIIQFE
jgi:CRP/FNR family cyclic AMP-dependent transcriptional regulator